MIKTPIFVCVLFLAVISTKAEAYTILVWGDSLSAAYGIPVEQGWVALLRKRLATRNIQVVNRSFSGQTTYDAVDRLFQGLVDTNPDLVILELGGNDGLRGLDLATTGANLATMIQLSQERGVKVLLLGMKIPPNYGLTYADAFHKIYLDLASKYHTASIPFFLEPVALDFDLMQEDGFHPTAAAQPKLLEHIWPTLSSFLGQQ